MNKKYLQIRIALISLLLLIGQFSVLIHSVEHPHHVQELSCQVYLQCEKSGNGLLFDGVQLPSQASNTLVVSRIISVWLSYPHRSYLSRAPPLFS